MWLLVLSDCVSMPDPGLETPSRDHINMNATSWIDCPEDRP